MKYLAKIKYLGTDFHGFQVQPGKRTVQGELCAALKEALGVPCLVTGSSRTDSGVHANGFVITVSADGATVPPEKLPLAAARFLPPDITITEAFPCDEKFHPRYDAKSKEYVYLIENARVQDPFLYGRSWFLPRYISENGIKLMNEAAKHIIGKHDFRAFMADGSDVTDTTRTVHYLTIKKDGDMIEIRISADGFLYNMVRIIVGTLTEVAFGRFKPSFVKEIIASLDRKNAGPTAPPEGLYLNKVIY